jgi:hypothetical protein
LKELIDNLKLVAPATSTKLQYKDLESIFSHIPHMNTRPTFAFIRMNSKTSLVFAHLNEIVKDNISCPPLFYSVTDVHESFRFAQSLCSTHSSYLTPEKVATLWERCTARNSAVDPNTLELLLKLFQYLIQLRDLQRYKILKYPTKLGELKPVVGLVYPLSQEALVLADKADNIGDITERLSPTWENDVDLQFTETIDGVLQDLNSPRFFDIVQIMNKDNHNLENIAEILSTLRICKMQQIQLDTTFAQTSFQAKTVKVDKYIFKVSSFSRLVAI